MTFLGRGRDTIPHPDSDLPEEGCSGTVMHRRAAESDPA